MKSILHIFLATLIILSLFLVVCSNFGAVQGTTPVGDLLVYWTFNEGNGNFTLDSSGNNYNCDLHGASWVKVQDNCALQFDGVSDYVDVPSLPLSEVTSLSVVAWINSDFSKNGYIFYHGSTGEFLLHIGERIDVDCIAGRYPNLACFSVKLEDSIWFDVYSSELQPNVWHQIVGVWTKGVSLKIYVDGTLAAENNAINSGYLVNEENGWPHHEFPSLGVYNRGTEESTYYKGLLDNVMVYTKALNAQEIAELYTNKSTLTPAFSVSPIVAAMPTNTLQPILSTIETVEPTSQLTSPTSTMIVTHYNNKPDTSFETYVITVSMIIVVVAAVVLLLKIRKTK